VCTFICEVGYEIGLDGASCVETPEAIVLQEVLEGSVKGAAATSHISSAVMTGM
jgi:hypothetical protein